MDSAQEKKLPGWAVALLVIFYPVGLLYLLYSHVNKKNDPRDGFTHKSVVATVAGGFLVFSGIFYLISAAIGNVVAEDEDSILLGAVIMLAAGLGGGAALLIYGNRCRKLEQLHKRYVPGILNEGMEKIDEIALFAGVRREEAAEDLRKLLDAGALRGFSIDYGERKLVWPDAIAPKQNRVTKICPNCGGMNEIILGRSEMCAFCNSSLN